MLLLFVQVRIGVMSGGVGARVTNPPHNLISLLKAGLDDTVNDHTSINSLWTGTRLCSAHGKDPRNVC